MLLCIATYIGVTSGASPNISFYTQFCSPFVSLNKASVKRKTRRKGRPGLRIARPLYLSIWSLLLLGVFFI
ncbi:hypothetical protein J3Q64DRAFT_1822522 [Phycomyces blakesleeanus]|uniref:Uncharacterized protein n=1 Tax=Phycomyces blakesleeanus TaxID=4837 RepID=A0ABR3AXB3_PHYBL